ncbi:MAG: CNNM domain-containing protein [bacterium]
MIYSYLIIAGLVLMSAIFSGMTIGMFSFRTEDLEAKMNSGDIRAARVFHLRKNPSLLLSTLLMGNVAVNSAISIYLGSLASGLIAVLIATGLITLVGELFPQALFSRHTMRYIPYFLWFVRLVEVILYPITKPLSLLLDLMLGKEKNKVLSKKEISEIIKKQEDEPGSDIDADEERIILGALTFSDKTAINIGTPATVVYYLNESTEINTQLIEEIVRHGFSRIPLYSNTPDNMTGILYVKDLIKLIGQSRTITVGEISRVNKILKVDEDIKLDILFNELIKSKIHLAILYDEFGAFSGIITLEDIVEEILSVEIVDEQDEFTDMQKVAKDKSKLRHRINNN